ncbi:MAG: hypothetical protein MJ182_09855 [Treponema sp.]|nr:hypothetical protein [Treponema sp.]
MFNFFWPVALIVFSNILYQVCAKGIPSQMNTYASMAVTYAVATVFSAIMYSWSCNLFSWTLVYKKIKIKKWRDYESYHYRLGQNFTQN